MPELIIENFDLEQIWQQIELQNEEVLDKNITQISRVLTSKDLLFKKLEIPEDDSQEEQEVEEEEVEEEIENDFSEDENESSDKLKQHSKKSVVDDDFFKLEEMEEFLNKEEKALQENNNQKADDSDDSEGSIDLFKEDGLDEDDENDRLNNPRYKDFFVDNSKPKQKRNKFFEEEESLSNEEQELKSSLELRDERLRRKIEVLEEQALSEKPWQLKGEITADKRPQNSLLEEIVDFDLSSRPGKIFFTKLQTIFNK